MSNIINFQDKAVEMGDHVAGEFECTHCAHSWNSIKSLDVPAIDCPNCGRYTGVPKHRVITPEGTSVFLCEVCKQSDVFHLLDTGETFCPLCGNTQTMQSFVDAVTNN